MNTASASWRQLRRRRLAFSLLTLAYYYALLLSPLLQRSHRCSRRRHDDCRRLAGVEAVGQLYITFKAPLTGAPLAERGAYFDRLEATTTKAPPASTLADGTPAKTEAQKGRERAFSNLPAAKFSQAYGVIIRKLDGAFSTKLGSTKCQSWRRIAVIKVTRRFESRRLDCGNFRIST